MAGGPLGPIERAIGALPPHAGAGLVGFMFFFFASTSFFSTPRLPEEKVPVPH